ncbi:MAG: hypothetical protein ACLQNE_20225 [Thermoguttaceae bacterium]
MASESLWPPVGASPPRTMAEMLYDAAGDLGTLTNGKLDFYVDAVGVAPSVSGPVTQIRYNCYIRVIAKSYLHLFFQVTTPSSGPFDAEFGTPEGDRFPPVRNEDELRKVIRDVLQRPRTKEVVEYLLRLAIP